MKTQNIDLKHFSVHSVASIFSSNMGKTSSKINRHAHNGKFSN